VDNTSAIGSGSQKRGPFLVVIVPDIAWFATAKTMLRFVYTQLLEPNTPRLELLRLLKLAVTTMTCAA
jgi:hypothetical protein